MKQEESQVFGPHTINELINVCSKNDEEGLLEAKLKAMNLETLVRVFENGIARIDKLIGYLGNQGNEERDANFVSKQKDEFLERVVFEEEYEKMKKRVAEKKKENTVLKEKFIIIELRMKELAKEKLQLRKDLDSKIYEKYEFLKTITKDYEQTKMDNIKYLDRIDELERQKEVIQDGYHLFSEENERLRREIRRLYAEKVAWFQDRDQILAKLEVLDVEKLRRAKGTIRALSGSNGSADLEAICSGLRQTVDKLALCVEGEDRAQKLFLEVQRISAKGQDENTNPSNIMQIRHDDSHLKRLKNDSVIKGLTMKNRVLRNENQKYFDFILELKHFLKLESNGVADRIMTLVEKNVDNMSLQKKLDSAQKNAAFLERQNEEYRQEMETSLLKINSALEKEKLIKKSLFKQIGVVCLENLRLRKLSKNLGSVSMHLSRELSQSSSLLKGLVESAQQEIKEAGNILSRKFWQSIGEGVKNMSRDKSGDQDIFSKTQDPEIQEHLLYLMGQSSAEANEQRISRVKQNLTNVMQYLREGGEDCPRLDDLEVLEDKEKGKRIRKQLKKNAEGLFRGVFCLWQRDREWSRLKGLKKQCIARNEAQLQKRAIMNN